MFSHEIIYVDNVVIVYDNAMKLRKSGTLGFVETDKRALDK